MTRELAGISVRGAGGKLLPYGALDRESAKVEIGDSVVFGFRVQAFVTRAYIAAVRGISRGAAGRGL